MRGIIAWGEWEERYVIGSDEPNIITWGGRGRAERDYNLRGVGRDIHYSMEKRTTSADKREHYNLRKVGTGPYIIVWRKEPHIVIMQVIKLATSYILAILVARYYMSVWVIQVTLQRLYMDTSSLRLTTTLRGLASKLIHWNYQTRRSLLKVSFEDFCDIHANLHYWTRVLKACQHKNHPLLCPPRLQLLPDTP